MAKALFCIANSEYQAESIVTQLKFARFREADVSVLFSDKSGTRGFAHERKSPEGPITGIGAAGLLGGALGWLTGVGPLAVPGVGPFIAAGPILSALRGATAGVGARGIAGALAGMGLPEYKAKRYEDKIRAGNILISVHCENSVQARKAKEVFEADEARSIAVASEAPVIAGEKVSDYDFREDRWEKF